MSSFIAHGLAALSVYSYEKQPISAYISRKFWFVWLIVIASAPDIDYIFSSLRVMTDAHQRIRITHSILLSFVLPFATVLVLISLNFRGNILNSLGKQAFLAAFSHLALDLLVGVTQLPLLWPLSTKTFKMPFGILPSAGKLNIFNSLLYRNLLIEIGILAPLFYSIYLISHNLNTCTIQKVRIGGLLIISICFMFWSISLSR